MKKEILYSAAVLLVAATALTGCYKESSSKTSEQQWTMNVEASKGGEATKALTLGPTTISAAWATTEKVAVMDATNATNFGTLSPKTAGASTRLSGTLTGSFAVNDNLNLYFPSTAYVSGTGVVLDYTGQDGTMATIASKYDYSVASVTATTVDNASQSFETTAATFANQQAIAGFTFVNGSGVITVKSLSIGSTTGNLVQKATIGSTTTYTYGNITVTPPTPTSSMIYVALNNQKGSSDTYYFWVTDTDDKEWMGKASANLVAGTFVPVTSAISVPTQVGGKLDGHQWIQLYVGGPKWATHNIDLAQTSKETSSETAYKTSTKQNNAYFAIGLATAFQFNCNGASYSGDFAGLTTSPMFDAASVNWSTNWRTPGKSHMDALVGDDYTWTKFGNGVKDGAWVSGQKEDYYEVTYTGTSYQSTGKSLILPIPGYFISDNSAYYSHITDDGIYGYYMTTSPSGGNNNDSSLYREITYILSLDNANAPKVAWMRRTIGISVRPIVK
jgi:hypothetical protein